MGLVECRSCTKRFTEQDILDGAFFPETQTCYECYRGMQEAPLSISCFGKYASDSFLGFSISAVECRYHCPDRRLCPKFASGEIPKFRKQVIKQAKEALAKPVVSKSLDEKRLDRSFPFRQGSAVHEAFLLCMAGTSVKGLRSLARKKKVAYERLIRLFRKGNRYGKRWQFREEADKIRIVFPIQ